MSALCICDLEYYTTGVAVIDHVIKNTYSKFLHIETQLGGRMVTIIFSGELHDILETEAEIIKFSNENFPNNLKNVLTISNPHIRLLKIIEKR